MKQSRNPKNVACRSVHPQRLSQLIIATLELALFISRLQENRQPVHDAWRHLDEYLERNVRCKARLY